MGTFVVNPSENPFEFNSDAPFQSGTGAYTLATEKFEQAYSYSEKMLDLLLGGDLSGGYLAEMKNALTNIEVPEIGDFSVALNPIDTSVHSAPSVNDVDIDTDFGDFEESAPILSSLPTVDISGIERGSLPEDINTAISWLESNYDNSLVETLLARLVEDLKHGATGLAADVEQEIFDRAKYRQQIEYDKQQQETMEFFSARGFDLPTGVMVGRMQELSNNQALLTSDLNGKIAIEQAELAQKNSQFVIQITKDLEAVRQDFHSKRNDRALDYAKAVAANAIALYSEKVKAYVAVSQANVMEVEVQVENLKAVVEYNKGLVDSYAAQAKVYETVVNSKSKVNEAKIAVLDAEVKGYEIETSAITAGRETEIKYLALKVQEADMNVRAAIAEAEQAVKAAGIDSEIKVKVAEAMANIASQALASSLGSVNASAGLSNSHSEGLSESWAHNESRSVGWDHNGSISETHTYEEEAS